MTHVAKFLTNDGSEIFPNVNCRKTTINEFSKLKLQPNSFSIIHVNIRSARENFSSLESLLSLNKQCFDVIALTETWLSENTDHTYNLLGYKKFSLYRNGRGGGITVYVKGSHAVELVNGLSFMSEITEVLTLNIHNANINFNFSCVYRPPSTSIHDFNSALSDHIFPLLNQSKSILCGDININLFNPRNINSIQDFISTMSGHNYFPLINIPTRFSPENPITKYSLIDHIWSNFTPDNIFNSGVIEYEVTDHLPVYCYFGSVPEEVNYFTYRKFNDEGKIDGFIRDVQAIVFVNDNQEDPNAMASHFSSEIYSAFHRNFPLCRRRVNEGTCGSKWMNEDLKRLIKKKHKLLSLSRRGLITRHSYIYFRNQLCFLIKLTKKSFYLNKINDSRSNPKRLWQEINGIIGRKTKVDKVNKLVSEEGELFGRDMANHFNSHFTSIASKLVNDLLPSNIPFQIFAPYIDNSCELTEVTPSEVKDIIVSFKNKRFYKNEIQPKLLISVVDNICTVLCNIFNECFNKRVFPDCFKIARVVPVYKAGNVVEADNFRPISNLNIFNKVFEKIIYSRLSNFVETENIVTNHQYGFKRGSNTSYAILEFMSYVLKSLHDRHFTVALYLDLKKAFDTVDITILSRKLHHYGMRNGVNEFLLDYFKNRKQFVQVNDFNSDLQDITVGLTQGSYNSPLLFSIFINDLCNYSHSHGFNCTFYADDAVFYSSGSSLEEINLKVNDFMKKLSDWLIINKLTPNVSKTKLMLFSNVKVDNLPQIYFDTVLLDWVDDFKYLGVFLDSRLTFSSHIKYLCNRLSKIQGIMYASSPFLNQASLLTIYHSLAYSIITQSIIIFGKTTANHILPLQILMNKILRLILKVRYNEHHIPLVRTNEMYISLRLFKFDDICNYFLTKFLRKALYEDFNLLEKYFIQLLPNHDYPNRQQKLILPAVRLEVERNSTIFQCISHFNSLPAYLKEPMSDFRFKKEYKGYIMEKYVNEN